MISASSSGPCLGEIFALGLDEDDELISAHLTDGNHDIFIATSRGKAIRFHESAVRAMGRPARGVRSIRLDGDDRVVGMVAALEDMLILSMTEYGYGKRTKLDQYRLTARGGKGIINIKTSKRNGNVISIMTVTKEDDLMIITRNGQDHPHRVGQDPGHRTLGAGSPAGEPRGWR